MWVLFAYFSLSNTCIWLVYDSVKITKQTSWGHMLKDVGLHPQFLLVALHSIMNALGKTYVFSQEINKHALWITITI